MSPSPKNGLVRSPLSASPLASAFWWGRASLAFSRTISYQAPLWAASALSFTSIVFTFFLLPRKEPVHQHPPKIEVGPGGKRLSLISWGQYAQVLPRPANVALAGAMVLFLAIVFHFHCGLRAVCRTALSVAWACGGRREVGYIFAFNGFIGIIMQGGVVGRLVKALGERRVVEIGFLGSLLGYAAMGFTYTIWQLLAS